MGLHVLLAIMFGIQGVTGARPAAHRSRPADCHRVYLGIGSIYMERAFGIVLI